MIVRFEAGPGSAGDYSLQAVCSFHCQGFICQLATGAEKSWLRVGNGPSCPYFTPVRFEASVLLPVRRPMQALLGGMCQTSQAAETSSKDSITVMALSHTRAFLTSLWKICTKRGQRRSSKCARAQSCSLPSTLLFPLVPTLSPLQDQALSYELSSHYRLSLFGI